MWISNTAATAMMIPIIEATLKELESQGIGNMFEDDVVELADDGKEKRQRTNDVVEAKKPTRTTMCYFISTAYAASIGGNGKNYFFNYMICILLSIISSGRIFCIYDLNYQ